MKALGSSSSPSGLPSGFGAADDEGAGELPVSAWVELVAEAVAEAESPVVAEAEDGRGGAGEEDDVAEGEADAEAETGVAALTVTLALDGAAWLPVGDAEIP